MDVEDIYAKWNKAVTKKTNTAWIHLYEVSKLVIFLEKNKMVVTRGWGVGKKKSCRSMGISISVLHNANTVNTNVLYT